MKDFTALQKSMVDVIQEYGVKNKTILDVMLKVPRHEFVPESMREHAYADCPLPIGYNQTISQPFTVAFMLDALELREGYSILEVGCGSGYNAALIKELVKDGKVVSVEVIKELVNFAKENLARLNYNIKVVSSDGSQGYKKDAPYDRIIATCACPSIPKPWITQLNEGGIIIAPVGTGLYQEMLKAKKIKGELKITSIGSFRFVPLVGRYGFREGF